MNKIVRHETDVETAYLLKLNSLTKNQTFDLDSTDNPEKTIHLTLTPTGSFKSRLIKNLLLLPQRVLKSLILKLRRYLVADIMHMANDALHESRLAREDVFNSINSMISALKENEHKIAQLNEKTQKELASFRSLFEPKNRFNLSGQSKDPKTAQDKRAIIVLGAGGHAKVCIELLQAMQEEVAFCVGDKHSAPICVGVPVLRGDHHLKQLRTEGYKRLFIAIGSNERRAELAKLSSELGFELVNAISPQAIISPSVCLGSGIAIMAGAVINAETVISDLAIINTAATIDHDCYIGKAAHIAPQCALAGKVRIGAQSFLGAGSKVIPEIEIFERVTVGAGTVVISDIGLGKTVVGVPARVVHEPLVDPKKIIKEYDATNICSAT